MIMPFMGGELTGGTSPWLLASASLQAVSTERASRLSRASRTAVR